MPQPASPSLVAAEAVQEGSRWINGRPEGPVFAKWFTDNVKLHSDKLEHDKYIGGIVLITGSEKIKVAQQASNGQVMIVEETRLVHTPYAKVETRVAYFWDWMSQNPEWVGIIEPVDIPRVSDMGVTVYNGNLPPGFFKLPISKAQGGVVNYIGCSMRVRVLKADSIKVVEERVGSPRLGFSDRQRVVGVPVAEYAPALKMVATVGKGGDEDPFVLMKAETGAVGRALGMAGMLVIPGSGVATAEDMMEAQQFEGTAASEAGAAASLQTAAPAGKPSPAAKAATQREEIPVMMARLEEERPEAFEEIRAWAKERNINLSEITDPAVRGVHKKLTDALALEG